jgi:hypothetical protein
LTLEIKQLRDARDGSQRHTKEYVSLHEHVQTPPALLEILALAIALLVTKQNGPMELL